MPPLPSPRASVPGWVPKPWHRLRAGPAPRGEALVCPLGAHGANSPRPAAIPPPLRAAGPIGGIPAHRALPHWRAEARCARGAVVARQAGLPARKQASPHAVPRNMLWIACVAGLGRATDTAVSDPLYRAPAPPSALCPRLGRVCFRHRGRAPRHRSIPPYCASPAARPPQQAFDGPPTSPHTRWPPRAPSPACGLAHLRVAAGNVHFGSVLRRLVHRAVRRVLVHPAVSVS